MELNKSAFVIHFTVYHKYYYLTSAQTYFLYHNHHLEAQLLAAQSVNHSFSNRVMAKCN